MNSPLVSVLVCTFNAERFIEPTMRSVMNQTYANIEILVLDNASSDRTAGMLERIGGEEPRLKLYVGRENLGAYGGLNYLLERASGTYIAINDHDDIWHADKLRKQVEFLEEHKEYIGCGTAIVNYYEKYDTYLLRRQPRVSNIAWHTSLVFRHSSLRYDASLKVGNDFHFMKHLLCGNNRRILNLGEPYVLRPIRADHSNLSTRWIGFRNFADIIRVRMNALDKMALLMRLFLPERFADFLVLKVFFRRNVLPGIHTAAYFSGKGSMPSR